MAKGNVRFEVITGYSKEAKTGFLYGLGRINAPAMIVGIYEEEEDLDSRLASEIYETPIENLDLSVRVFNSLKRAGIVTVGEVLELLEKGEDAIMSIRNFGDKSLEELVLRMTEKGYLESDEAEEDSEEEIEVE